MWACCWITCSMLCSTFILLIKVKSISGGSVLSPRGYLDEDDRSNTIHGVESCLTKSVVPSEFELGRSFGGEFDGENNKVFPCWFDLESARLGQKFARRYFPQLINSHFLSLFLLIMNPDIRRVLVFTRKSSTPDKAFQRYMATVLQVKLWYDTDILHSNWSASIDKVRRLHSGMSYYIQNELRDISGPLLTEDHNPTGFRPNRELWDAFKRDIELSGLNKSLKCVTITESVQPKYFINQYGMAITQWSFMALPLLFSDQIHLVWPTERELIGFAHLWATISYRLGMNESFILCKDQDLNKCEKNLKVMLKEYFLPYLYHIDYETQIMLESLCHVVSGVIPQVTSELFIIQLLEDIVGIPCPNLRRYASWYTKLLRSIQQIAEPFYHWPGMQWIGNVFLRGQVQLSSLRVFGFDGTDPNIVAERGFH